VVYTIVGNRCYFSGIECELRTSTINAAESIMQAISEQEGVPVNRLRWFDLQTHRGYGGKRPGEFKINELAIRADPAGARRGSTRKTKIGGEMAIVIRRTLTISSSADGILFSALQRSTNSSASTSTAEKTSPTEMLHFGGAFLFLFRSFTFY